MPGAVQQNEVLGTRNRVARLHCIYPQNLKVWVWVVNFFIYVHVLDELGTYNIGTYLVQVLGQEFCGFSPCTVHIYIYTLSNTPVRAGGWQKAGKAGVRSMSCTHILAIKPRTWLTYCRLSCFVEVLHFGVETYILVFMILKSVCPRAP